MRSNMREALMRSTVVASSIRLHPRFGHTSGHKKKYNCILIHTPSHRPHIVKVMGLDALECARDLDAFDSRRVLDSVASSIRSPLVTRRGTMASSYTHSHIDHSHIDHDTTSEGVHSGAVWVLGRVAARSRCFLDFSYDTVRGCTSQLSKGCKGCVIGGSVTMMRETCGSSVTIPLSPDERAMGRGQLDEEP